MLNSTALVFYPAHSIVLNILTSRMRWLIDDGLRWSDYYHYNVLTINRKQEEGKIGKRPCSVLHL